MSEPVTVIGANTVVNGNLEGDEDLTIEGRVEGTVNLSRTLTIENNGVVHANINVRNAVISGVLVGNIEAEDSVHVTEDGRVVGDIAAPRVILVDGASFRGNIDMGNFDVDRLESNEQTSAPKQMVSVKYHGKPPEEVEVRKPVERVRPAVVSTRVVVAPKPKPAEPIKVRPSPAEPTKVRPSVKGAPEKSRAVSTGRKRAPVPKSRAVGKAKATRKKR